MAPSPGPPGPQLIEVADERALPAALVGAGLAGRQPVIVLIGGAARLDDAIAAALEPLVREGIVGTAARLGAAVIDGGTDAGVMALAGRARDALAVSLPLIGVVPRGRIRAPGIDGGGTTDLEPNHSHALVVPGDEWGSESALLVATARLLAEGRQVVAVLLDGGPVALTEAMACAAEGWPIVTVAGSGRSADILAGYARGEREPTLATTDRRRIEVLDLAAGPTVLATMLARLLEGGGSVPSPETEFGTADYPALYVASSEAAKRGQQLHRWLSLGEILMTTIGLGIALAAGLIFGTDTQARNLIGGTGTALAFLIALILKLIHRSSGFEADWLAGRALAETVKSLTWRYMMRSPPYAQADADRRLRVDLATALRRRASFRQPLDRLPTRPQQISPRMREVRALDLADRRDYYLGQRVQDQADWYRSRGARNSRWSGRWYWLSIGAQLAGVVFALVALAVIAAGIEANPLPLVALFGAVALAMAAWSQLNRYDELARSYAVALHELLLIEAIGHDVADQPALDELVNDAEEAIGREHRMWIAKRSEAPDEDFAEGELEHVDGASAGLGDTATGPD